MSEWMAPNREARIAAHRAPRVRFQDRVRVFAFSVHMGAWACWNYNRRLFWQLVLGLTGFAFIAASLVMLIVRSVF